MSFAELNHYCLELNQKVFCHSAFGFLLLPFLSNFRQLPYVKEVDSCGYLEGSLPVPHSHSFITIKTFGFSTWSKRSGKKSSKLQMMNLAKVFHDYIRTSYKKIKENLLTKCSPVIALDLTYSLVLDSSISYLMCKTTQNCTQLCVSVWFQCPRWSLSKKWAQDGTV